MGMGNLDVPPRDDLHEHEHEHDHDRNQLAQNQARHSSYVDPKSDETARARPDATSDDRGGGGGGARVGAVSHLGRMGMGENVDGDGYSEQTHSSDVAVYDPFGL